MVLVTRWGPTASSAMYAGEVQRLLASCRGDRQVRGGPACTYIVIDSSTVFCGHVRTHQRCVDVGQHGAGGCTQKAMLMMPSANATSHTHLNLGVELEVFAAVDHLHDVGVLACCTNAIAGGRKQGGRALWVLRGQQQTVRACPAAGQSVRAPPPLPHPGAWVSGGPPPPSFAS